MLHRNPKHRSKECPFLAITSPSRQDTANRGAADRSRINMQEDDEVRYWTEKWSATREQLAAAVRAVGVMVKNVAAKLGKAP